MSLTLTHNWQGIYLVDIDDDDDDDDWALLEEKEEGFGDLATLWNDVIKPKNVIISVGVM